MTGPLAPLFAQVRDVVPSREEIERRIGDAEAVIEEPDEYVREYLTDARREVSRCKRLLVADAALSSIERHVQDMDLKFGRIIEYRPCLRFDITPCDQRAELEEIEWCPLCVARAALPASGTRNRVAREEEEE